MKLEVYARAIRGLMELEPDRERQLKYVDFIDIYTALDDNEMKAYEKQYPQETKTMAGLRERLLAEGEQRGVQQGLEQGLEKGLEQGLEKGKATGERAVLLLQLSHRFGPLDEATLERLETASSDELDLLADKALDANSLEEALSRS